MKLDSTKVSTAFIYLVAILVTCFLIYLLVKPSKQKVLPLGKDGQRLPVYKKDNFYLVVVAFLPLILLSGFRYFTGADYQQYIWNFDHVIEAPNRFLYIITDKEPLYALSIEIVYILFGYNPYVWFLIMAMATFVFLAKAITLLEREGKFNYIVFAFAYGCFVFLYSLNFVRQIFALSAILLGLVYSCRKEWLKFLACSALALLFHRSAILFFALGVFFLCVRKFKLYWLYYIVLAISPFVIMYMGEIVKIIPFLSQYEKYFIGKSFNVGYGWIIDVAPVILMWIILSLPTKLKHTLPQENAMADTFANVSLLVVPIRLLSYYTYAGGRSYIDCILMCLVAFSMLTSLKDWKKWTPVALFALLYMLMLVYTNASEVVPYRFIIGL